MSIRVVSWRWGGVAVSCRVLLAPHRVGIVGFVVLVGLSKVMQSTFVSTVGHCDLVVLLVPL